MLHSSIALHKDIETRPLSLEKCLDTFTAQEDIKEVGGRFRASVPDGTCGVVWRITVRVDGVRALCVVSGRLSFR